MTLIETQTLQSRDTSHKVLLELPGEEDLLSPAEIAQRIRIADKVHPDLKVFCYFSQPRGCSTATGAAWGSLDWLEGKVHFQPWKYLQRYGRKFGISKLNLVEEGQTLVGLKETPGGPNYMSELFDPLDILIRAGLSQKYLAAVLTARHPLHQFESILKFDTRRKAEIYLAGQKYLMNLRATYVDRGITTVPFAVEMYHGMEAEATQALFIAMGLDTSKYTIPPKITFKKPDAGVIWHEADPKVDPHYYETVVHEVVSRSIFSFPKPKGSDFPLVAEYIPTLQQDELWTIAMNRYIEYAELASKFLFNRTGFKNEWFDNEFIPQSKADAKNHGAWIS